MELPDPGIFPIANIILLLWYVYAICVPEALGATGLEAGQPNLHSYDCWLVKAQTSSTTLNRSFFARELLEENGYVYEHETAAYMSTKRLCIWAWSGCVYEHETAVYMSMKRLCIWAWSGYVYEHETAVYMSMKRLCIWAWNGCVYEHETFFSASRNTIDREWIISVID
jgi:hypothetical protein